MSESKMVESNAKNSAIWEIIFLYQIRQKALR
jgi:hypothetical protein